MYQGKKTEHRKHRKYERGREAAETKIGEIKQKKVKTKGGGEKIKLLSSGKFANVVLKGGKAIKCEILSVVENPGNKDFTRRNIITKGALLKVKTPENKEIKVRVTSRSGQDGVINAISL
jgi:small subunit ribosomal protein S8e